MAYRLVRPDPNPRPTVRPDPKPKPKPNPNANPNPDPNQETKRQLDVLDQQLATRSFVAGETFTLADCAIWPWYAYDPKPRPIPSH